MGAATLPIMPRAASPREYYLLVFAGQSMNSDRAPLADFPPFPYASRVENFTNRWTYEPATLEFDSPVGQTDTVSQDPGTEGLGGVGLPTGNEFCRLRKSAHVILLPCARGSTSITQWMKTDGLSRVTLYGSMIQRINRVQQDRNLKGVVILFNQGNKDRNSPDSVVDAWADMCLTMRDHISADIGIPNVPIVIGVSPTTVAGDSPKLQRIMAQQLAMTGPNLRVLDARAFPIDAGGHHTATGFCMLGNGYAALAHELLPGNEATG